MIKRPHIITISGKPGSGKSSTADKVAELLNYTRYSAGDTVRDYVKKHKLTLKDFNMRAEKDAELDHMVDEALRDLRDHKDVIVDSRLGFYWIPESFKVYLDLDLDVATARIFKDTTLHEGRNKSGERVSTMNDAMKNVRSRMKNEQRRYKNRYGVDPYDTAHFDLVINTSRHSPQTVALTVFDHYKQWLKSEEWKPVYSEVPMGYTLDDDY